jgi:hypothetical protein
MAKRTTIHFNGDADPITVEEDFDSVKLAIGGSPRQTHDFVRVVGDNRTRVMILKTSVAYVEETEVSDVPLVAAV